MGSGRYAEEPIIGMAVTPSTQSMPKQFLQPLARMESLMRAHPPTAAEMKLEKKVERAMQKAMPVAGVLVGPSAAHAFERTPSLDNWINSLHYGGLLVIVIAVALLAVADLDPVSRS